MRPPKPQGPLQVVVREITPAGRELLVDLLADGWATASLDGVAAVWERLELRGMLTTAGELAYARGRITGSVALECSRCLGPAAFVIDGEFTRVLVPRGTDQAAALGAADGAHEEPDVAVFDDGLIDLAPVVREEILVALPYALLCREDCPGLCVQCGKPKADGACGCVATPVDDRWSGLRGLQVANRVDSAAAALAAPAAPEQDENDQSGENDRSTSASKSIAREGR